MANNVEEYNGLQVGDYKLDVTITGVKGDQGPKGDKGDPGEVKSYTNTDKNLSIDNKKDTINLSNDVVSKLNSIIDSTEVENIIKSKLKLEVNENKLSLLYGEESICTVDLPASAEDVGPKLITSIQMLDKKLALEYTTNKTYKVNPKVEPSNTTEKVSYKLNTLLQTSTGSYDNETLETATGVASIDENGLVSWNMPGKVEVVASNSDGTITDNVIIDNYQPDVVKATINLSRYDESNKIKFYSNNKDVMINIPNQGALLKIAPNDVYKIYYDTNNAGISFLKAYCDFYQGNANTEYPMYAYSNTSSESDVKYLNTTPCESIKFSNSYIKGQHNEKYALECIVVSATDEYAECGPINGPIYYNTKMPISDPDYVYFTLRYNWRYDNSTEKWDGKQQTIDALLDKETGLYKYIKIEKNGEKIYGGLD